ncbi:TRPT1, partial [Symbiodinium sp. CCMP2456]
VTVGQVAATINVEVPDQAIRLLPPTAFTGKCSSDNGGIVTLDTVTGQGTYEGFPFFDMDLTTGSVRLAPSQELASLMPTDAGARAALTLSCTIYGLYQFPPFGDGPVLQEVIYLGATDDTCFVPKTGNYYFLELHSLLFTSDSAFQQQFEVCLGRDFGDHSMFWSKMCAVLQQEPGNSGHRPCDPFSRSEKNNLLCMKERLSCTACAAVTNWPDPKLVAAEASGNVFARVLGCAERATCIQLSLSKHFLSGRYCYYGENNYR